MGHPEGVLVVCSAKEKLDRFVPPLAWCALPSAAIDGLMSTTQQLETVLVDVSVESEPGRLFACGRHGRRLPLGGDA